jgi:hypothetical protein
LQFKPRSAGAVKEPQEGVKQTVGSPCRFEEPDNEIKTQQPHSLKSWHSPNNIRKEGLLPMVAQLL